MLPYNSKCCQNGFNMLLRNSRKKYLYFWLFSILFLLPVDNNVFAQNLAKNIVDNDVNKNNYTQENISENTDNNEDDLPDFSNLGVLKDIIEDEELPIAKTQPLEEDDKIFLNPAIFDSKKKTELLAKPLIIDEDIKPKIFRNRIIADASFIDNNQNNNINNNFTDTNGNIRLISSLDITKHFELNSFIRMGRFDSPNQSARRVNSAHGGGDRTFENTDIIIGELNLKYTHQNSAIIAGKFSGNFGTAWRWNRGIWIHKTPSQYSLNNKLGFTAVQKVGNAKTVGLYNFSFGLFTNDSTNLDKTLFHKIAIESSKQSKAGDTKKLDSFNLATDIIFDFANNEKLSYHLAFASLNVNSKRSSLPVNILKRQNGWVFGINYNNKLKKDLDFENVIEYAKINNVDGNSNIDDSYFSVNLITTFVKKYSLLLGNSNKNSKRYLGKSFRENTSEINIGYDFTANKVFDRLVLQLGYQHYVNKTTLNTKQSFNSLGCLLRYYKNF